MQPPLIEDPADHESDVLAIKGIVADVETGFNTNDADLLTAHFAHNGSGVTATGVQLDGRDVLHAANVQGVQGFLRDQYVKYEVTDIVFLRADVAVAHKIATATDPDGVPIDVGHAMVGLYVLVKEQGRWWIAARQNTLAGAQLSPG
jgi:uncharacterized protein (TIGR02246 family)